MRKLVLALGLLLPVLSSAQETDSNTTLLSDFLDHLTGSLETNAQWYSNDTKLGPFEDPYAPFEVRNEQFRANSYLRLDYRFLKHCTVGLQL